MICGELRGVLVKKCCRKININEEVQKGRIMPPTLVSNSVARS
jgi:hypothetical protein